MAVKLQLRRDTSASWSASNPILAEGEVGVDTTLRQAKVGDGVLAWNSLPWGLNSFGAPVTKTGDFTVAATENVLINNKAGSTCTVTLPAAASNTGRQILVKNLQAQTVVSASSNVVPRAGGAAGTAILASGAGNWATLVSDGTNWVVMAGS